MPRRRASTAAAALLLAAATPAAAAETASGPEAGQPATLLGDLAGLRPWLKAYGASLDLSETSEVLGNPVGGVRRGAVYEGVTNLGLKLDLHPYFHWNGAFFVSAYQIHGRGLSANNLDNLMTVSGIEATRATRLFELWYEQKFGDRVELRVGQLNAGQDFMVSSTASVFVNATFGWPTLPALDLPSGGPTYPLATPAVRLRADLTNEVTLYAGAFNGDPAGAGLGDPQRRDASGTAFRTSDGVLALGELRYHPAGAAASGTYRLGAWYDSERFADMRLAANGVPLASPASDGRPRLHNGDYGIYAVIDQPLFRQGQSDRGLSVFARALGAPGDRNLVDLYLDGGATYRGIFADDDTLGLAVAYARIGPSARGSDADTAAFGGAPVAIRSGEATIELTYQVSIRPWWQVQPDLQYIIDPGGGTSDPLAPPGRIRNAVVGGLRTVVTF